MKNIYLLGATGSIGTQVLEILDYKKDLNLKSISVGYNLKKAKKIIEKYNPEFVSVIKKEDCEQLQKEFPLLNVGYGEDGLINAATYSDEEGFLINAVVGMVGLKPTIAAINRGRTILLANKETLVVAGEIITKLAKEKNVDIIPIDSEHSAIFQCLEGRKIDEVSRLIITASGGSFRDKTRDELKTVTIKDALNHPNWDMGAKITVDSATMVNKGLEVIEAHFLFNIPYNNITTLIHNESIIHSMVEFKDFSTIAQLSYPDMRIPIQYALTYPNKEAFPFGRPLKLEDLKCLSFKNMDFNRYPLLKLAYEVGKLGGIMPTVYNASNEEAVRLFIEGKINFLEIENIIFESINNANNIIKPSIDDIIKIATFVKEEINNKYR